MFLVLYVFVFCFVLEGRDWFPRPGPLTPREEVFLEDQSDVFSVRLSSLVNKTLS